MSRDVTSTSLFFIVSRSEGLLCSGFVGITSFLLHSQFNNLFVGITSFLLQSQFNNLFIIDIICFQIVYSFDRVKSKNLRSDCNS